MSAGTAFNFLGIPVYGVSYSSTIFPIILCCAVMAPIEKFVAKHSPAILRSVLEPLVTIVIMIRWLTAYWAPLARSLAPTSAPLCCGCTTPLALWAWRCLLP